MIESARMNPIRLRLLPLLAAALMVSGCNLIGEDDANVDAMDNNLTATNVQDPALTAALQDQIMVDPRLGQQANGDAIRPPGQPYSAPVPSPNIATNTDPVEGEKLLRAPAPVSGGQCSQCDTAKQAATLGGLAARQKNARTRGCASSLQYGAAWATRLPAGVPLYPRAHVTEAAGTGGSCALRVVSFAASESMQHLLDWYYTRASRAGYTAEHQTDGAQHVLGGTRSRDDAAYVIYFTGRADGGTDVDVIANNGI